MSRAKRLTNCYALGPNKKLSVRGSVLIWQKGEKEDRNRKTNEVKMRKDKTSEDAVR